MKFSEARFSSMSLSLPHEANLIAPLHMADLLVLGALLSPLLVRQLVRLLHSVLQIFLGPARKTIFPKFFLARKTYSDQQHKSIGFTGKFIDLKRFWSRTEYSMLTQRDLQWSEVWIYGEDVDEFDGREDVRSGEETLGYECRLPRIPMAAFEARRGNADTAHRQFCSCLLVGHSFSLSLSLSLSSPT